MRVSVNHYFGGLRLSTDKKWLFFLIGVSRMFAQVLQRFNLCLVVNRHKLLEIQKKDVETLCKRFTIVPELPNDASQLRQAIQQYDVIIGVLPLNLQIQILQNKKVYMTFVMTSLGVADNEEEANKIASQYPDRTVILYPAKQGEKYRVTRYDGLKILKEIKIVDEWILQHPI